LCLRGGDFFGNENSKKKKKNLLYFFLKTVSFFKYNEIYA
jgi:hypothetical protein